MLLLHRILCVPFLYARSENVIAKNSEAVTKGFKMGEHFAFTQDVHFTITPDTAVIKNLFMNGSEAIGFGALAAGCDFYAAHTQCHHLRMS